MLGNKSLSVPPGVIRSKKTADMSVLGNVRIEGVVLRSRGLNHKHLKALELLKNNMPVSEVVKQAGIQRSQIYDLIAGNEKAGPVAQEFGQEFQKKMEEQDKRIAEIQKDLKETVFTKLRAWTKTNKITEGNRKSFVDISKVLQTGPVYNIGSVSYSRGLSAEEMINEFKRLRAASEGALDRRTVSSLIPQGPGVLPVLAGRGNQAEEGQEDPSLPA